MGAKTWMIVGTDGDARQILKSRPRLDRGATLALVQRLFPSWQLEPLADGTLAYTSPPDDEIFAAVFPGLTVVAAIEYGIDYPSTPPPALRDPSLGRTVYLHAMHSVVDWFAYAIWENGELQRSLSINPEDAIIEEKGERLPFELPYWKGQHPPFEPGEEEPGYLLTFHPLELAEAALNAFFGYQLEGPADGSTLNPETIPLLRFKRSAKFSKPWWKIW